MCACAVGVFVLTDACCSLVCLLFAFAIRAFCCFVYALMYVFLYVQTSGSGREYENWALGLTSE